MRKFFKKIYKLIDKCIIVPISRLIFNIQNALKHNTGVLDRLLNRKTFLIYLSLILAVLLFVLTDKKVISLVEKNAEVINNVPVNLKYNKEAYVVEGAPKTVDITITGRKSDIYLAKQLGEFEVTLDLTNYTSSDSAYKVYFTYSKNIDNLTYRLDPSYVSVLIHNKVSEVRTVEYEFINQDKLDQKLSVKNITLSKNEVVVKGSETSLKKIALIKALVDLSDSDLTEAGTYDIDNVKLVAYDNNGKILDDIEIVPGTLSATLIIDSYSTTLPIEVKTVGKLVAGKSIASIQINNQSEYSVTAYGSDSIINSLKSIPVTINVDGAGNNSVEKYSVNISKPNGVRYMSVDNLNISLTFGTEQQKTLEITQNITQKNLGNGLTANIISEAGISVICKGVSSVIDNISEKDINAYVDLTGLTAGDHDVEIKIDNNNPLVTYIVSSTLKVRISSN